MSEITRFLLIYDHDRGCLIGSPREFRGDREAIGAVDAYDEAERNFANQQDRYEVLLVGAESIEVVKQTHGRFFRHVDHAIDAFKQAAL